MQRIRNSLLRLALTTSGLLSCSSAMGMGLMEAYQAALANDANYQAALHERDAAEENRALGRSALLPSLSYNLNKGKNRATYTLPIHEEQVYNSSAHSLSLRQPLISLDAYARFRQGQAQAEYGESVFESKTQDVKIRVANAYFDAGFAQTQLGLVEAQRSAMQEQLKLNQRMLDKGEGTKTEVLETQAKLDLTESQLIEAQDYVRQTRKALEAIVGSAVDKIDMVRSNFSLRAKDQLGYEEWRNLMLANNPEIKAQQAAVKAAEQEVSKARAGYLPRVDFYASLEKDSSASINTVGQDIKTRSVGIQLQLPIYSGGEVSAATSQAKANFEKSKSELDGKTREISVTLFRDYNAVLNSAAKIRALEKSIESAQLLVLATEQSIKGGVRINLDLLNAKAQLYAAMKELAQARYTYMLTYLHLRADAGVLDEQDLRDTAQYFSTAIE